MSRTVELATAVKEKCSACGRSDNVVGFPLEAGGPRSYVVLCAVCLASIIDMGLGTNYRLTVQVGLATRAAIKRIPKEKRDQQR